MSWIILVLAGLMEVGFTFCLGRLRPRSPIFVNAEAVKRYAAVFAQ